MQRTNWWPLVLGGTLAALGATCGDVEDTPPPVKALTRCEVDLTPWLGTGTGAKARVAAREDLLTGRAATGRPGDVVLSNARVRVVVEQPKPDVGPDRFGGNLIDADWVHDGPAHDEFGELGLLLQLGRTMDTEKLEILRDGQQGGAAVVAATGRDGTFEWVNVPGLVGRFLPGLQVPDADLPLNLRLTAYYVLAPDSNAVRVITGLCNDGDTTLALAAGDVIDGGGVVEILGGRSGFGGTGVGFDNAESVLRGTPGEPFAAWIADDVAYGWIPERDLNQVLTISGITGTMFDTKNLLDWTNGPNAPPPEGAVFVEPGATAVLQREFVVAREPGEIFTRYYTSRGTPAGTLSGKVLKADGTPASGTRVHVRNADRIVQLFTTDVRGEFTGLVPPGLVRVSADDGTVRTVESEITIAHGVSSTTELTLAAHAHLVAHVRADDGTPIPAKLTVQCEGECTPARAGAEALRFRDASLDALPGRTFAYLYLGPDGDASLDLPPGRYRVYASHGPEWSLFSQDVELAEGAEALVEARLGHVVDTTGWMSGDFHVHAINSPDSPIANLDRLRSFLAEGVDVIVSTDHDFVTDYAPFLSQIPDGDRWIRTVIGEELTTFDYGHYNAFPLVRDETRRNGGAVDWTGGPGPGLAPAELFERLHAAPGDQVVQVNHARAGFFGLTGLDTRTLWTRADPKLFRLSPRAPDPITGDTRLFDANFTALEIMNGFGGHVPLLNDWFSLLARGVKPTGTAVSDTHKRHGSSGYPRTYVHVGSDDPSTLDPALLARQVNAGEAFGTNGPVLSVKVFAESGGSAEPGGTLVSRGRPVQVYVEARTPDWMKIDEVLVFANAAHTETDADGVSPEALPEPAARITPTQKAVTVGAHEAHVARGSADLSLERDAWIVVLARGPGDLWPVVGKGGVTPLAFSNPVYVDVDGNGWTPPVDLAAERARVGSLSGSTSQPLRAKPTEADLRRVLAGDH